MIQMIYQIVLLVEKMHFVHCLKGKKLVFEHFYCYFYFEIGENAVDWGIPADNQTKVVYLATNLFCKT